MPLLGGFEVKAETLPSVPLDLTSADVAAIQPILHLALCRIEEQRLNGAAGLASDDAGGAFAGRRFSADMYARMRSLHEKVNRPGPIEADDIDLRMLAFLIRISRRFLSHPVPVPAGFEDTLEDVRKCAKRRAGVAEDKHRELAQTWEAFRQWCKFYLFESPKLKAHKRRAARSTVNPSVKVSMDNAKRPIAALLEIATSVINPESKLAADPDRLRAELYAFLHELKRGRWGVDVEDIHHDRKAVKDALIEFLSRRRFNWDLRREFQDLATRMSSDYAKARRFMDRSAEVDEAERAVEAVERATAAQQAAATMKPQGEAVVPVLAPRNTTSVSAAVPPPSPQQEPSQNESQLLFSNWLITDVLPEYRFKVFKDVLTRLHCREGLPFSAGRFSLAECRPAHRADRVKFYVDWALAWLLSWTSDLAKAQAVVGLSLEYAHKHWISIPVLDRERIVAEIHLRHFNETAAGPGYLYSRGAGS